MRLTAKGNPLEAALDEAGLALRWVPDKAIHEPPDVIPHSGAGQGGLGLGAP